MNTRRHKALLGLIVALGAACGCTSARAPDTAPSLMRAVRAPSPPPPAGCPDASRDADASATPPKAGQGGLTPRATLYIFTSDWCRACDRMLDSLTQARAKLDARSVFVRHVVTGEGDSCIAAARVARRAPFPYVAGSRKLEADWQIRSTPTMWLVDAQGVALLHVEGRPPMKALLESIDAQLNRP